MTVPRNALMESGRSKSRGRRTAAVGVGIGLLVIVAASVGIAVGLRSRKGDSPGAFPIVAPNRDTVRGVDGSIVETGLSTHSTPTLSPETPTRTTPAPDMPPPTDTSSTGTNVTDIPSPPPPPTNTSEPSMPPPAPPPPVSLTPTHAPSPCDWILADMDILGGDLPLTGSFSASNEVCLERCMSKSSCNAWTRLDGGRCFLKNIPEDFMVIDRDDATTYHVCPNEETPEDPDMGDSPSYNTSLTDAEVLQEYFSFGTVCPPDGIAYPQWTGRAESVIGVPTPIQTLYEQIEDENYNPVTKKYTLGFKALPGDLAYCTQGPTKLDKACREKKAVTSTLEECGNSTQGTELWTHNNGLKRCEAFTYNCGGNNNQFASLSLCQEACEQPTTATMGGTVTFSKGDGMCSLPPTKVDGSPCCVLRLWQPNYAGFYYDNCSVQRDLGGDGVYFFKTEIPGSELSAQWGPDPLPHIHYDILCNECAVNEYFSGEYRYWNKFYPDDICKLKSCYGNKNVHLAARPVHKAQDKQTLDGELLYTYNMALPSQDDPNGLSKLIG